MNDTLQLQYQINDLEDKIHGLELRLERIDAAMRVNDDASKGVGHTDRERGSDDRTVTSTVTGKLYYPAVEPSRRHRD